MKGYVVEIHRKDLDFGFFVSGVMLWNIKISEITSPIIYCACTCSNISKEKCFVFEDKCEAKEFKKLLERFSKLNGILTNKYLKKESLSYNPFKFKVVEVKAPKITYADFEQIMESFNGFEEEAEEAAKALKKFFKEN